MRKPLDKCQHCGQPLDRWVGDTTVFYKCGTEETNLPHDGLWRTMERHPACYEAELDKLREVVEKLPKTRDGVVITVGSRVYYKCESGEIIWLDVEWWSNSDNRIPEMGRYDDGFCVHGRNQHDESDHTPTDYCSSTRQAAEQAKGGEDVQS